MVYYNFSLYECFSCDADPAALAKYVVALVKKDKPTEELKDICVDQLEVFLSGGKILTQDSLWKRLILLTIRIDNFIHFLQYLSNETTSFFSETGTFVNTLFEALATSSYIPQPLAEPNPGPIASSAPLPKAVPSQSAPNSTTPQEKPRKSSISEDSRVLTEVIKHLM